MNDRALPGRCVAAEAAAKAAADRPENILSSSSPALLPALEWLRLSSLSWSSSAIALRNVGAATGASAGALASETAAAGTTRPPAAAVAAKGLADPDRLPAAVAGGAATGAAEPALARAGAASGSCTRRSLPVPPDTPIAATEVPGTAIKGTADEDDDAGSEPAAWLIDGFEMAAEAATDRGSPAAVGTELSAVPCAKPSTRRAELAAGAFSEAREDPPAAACACFDTSTSGGRAPPTELATAAKDSRSANNPRKRINWVTHTSAKHVISCVVLKVSAVSVRYGEQLQRCTVVMCVEAYETYRLDFLLLKAQQMSTSSALRA